jgi:phenylacetate-CoA ligase
MAQNCPAWPDRFHVHPERAVWETVRGDGTTASPGEVGRVVVTALDNFVMPFIRYDTGDLAVAGGDPCPCGRGLPLVGPVDGRTVECLRTPSGKIISTLSIITRVVPDISYVDVVRQYQLVQEAPDRVRLLIVPAGAVDDRWDRIRANLEDLFGEDVAVVMERVNEIPCEPSGKHLMLKSLLNSGLGSGVDPYTPESD